MIAKFCDASHMSNYDLSIEVGYVRFYWCTLQWYFWKKKTILKKQEFWVLLWNILALQLIFIKVSSILYWLLISILNTYIICIFKCFNFFMWLSATRDLVLQDKLAYLLLRNSAEWNIWLDQTMHIQIL